jgi:hypothetical protein
MRPSASHRWDTDYSEVGVGVGEYLPAALSGEDHPPDVPRGPRLDARAI